MLGFFAEAGPDEPQVGDELEDARWFTFDEVDAALRGASPEGGLLLSPSVSIPRWLVEYWHGALASQGRCRRRPPAGLNPVHSHGLASVGATGGQICYNPRGAG